MGDQSNAQVVVLRIRRQDHPDASPRWEEFTVPRVPGGNIISCLQYIAAHPVTTDGTPTTPVVYDCGCLEEVCGACTMLVNGKARQACAALVDRLEPTYTRQRSARDHPAYNPVDYGEHPPKRKRHAPQTEKPITLEPLTKFPVVRDLFVDRKRLFDDLTRTKSWVPIDGTYDLGPGPAMSRELQEERYVLSRCMSCACCLEACPQYSATNQFVGAAIFSQMKLFNTHPTGEVLKDERLDLMMKKGGIDDCGRAGNCVVVCPKDLPNLKSIATIGRQTTLAAIKAYFGG